MTNFLQIFSSTIIGTIVGATIWLIFVALFVSLIIYKFGGIQFGGFVGGSLEPEIPIILGAIIGAIQGFFIGLIIGFFNIDTVLNGGLTSFTTTEIILLLIYIKTAISGISHGIGIIESLGLGNFIFFSILLFIPTVIIGMITAKVYTFAHTMISASN